MTVSVENRARAGRLARLNDLITDGEDHYAWAGMHPDAVAAHARHQRHLARSHARSPSQHYLPGTGILGPWANVLSHRGTGFDLYHGLAVIGELQCHHRVRPGGDGRTGSNAHGSTAYIRHRFNIAGT